MFVSLRDSAFGSNRRAVISRRTLFRSYWTVVMLFLTGLSQFYTSISVVTPLKSFDKQENVSLSLEWVYDCITGACPTETGVLIILKNSLYETTFPIELSDPKNRILTYIFKLIIQNFFHWKTLYDNKLRIFCKSGIHFMGKISVAWVDSYHKLSLFSTDFVTTIYSFALTAVISNANAICEQRKRIVQFISKKIETTHLKVLLL